MWDLDGAFSCVLGGSLVSFNIDVAIVNFLLLIYIYNVMPFF